MLEMLVAAGSAGLFVALYFATGAYLQRLGGGWGVTRHSVLVAFAHAFLVFLGIWWTGVLGPLAAAMMGLGVNVALIGRVLQLNRRPLRVRALVERVRGADAANAANALKGLDYEIEGLRGGRGAEKPDYDHRAQMILAIAAEVSRAGHPERALEWTTRIESHILGRQTIAMLAQIEAGLRIATSDRAGARRALARAPRPAMAPWEDRLLALETLLEALDGDAQAATERASRALARGAAPPTKVYWQMARAHATAKLGAAQEAEDALRSIRSEGGDEFVKRVARHDGPASALAERLLGEQGAYR